MSTKVRLRVTSRSPWLVRLMVIVPAVAAVVGVTSMAISSSAPGASVTGNSVTQGG